MDFKVVLSGVYFPMKISWNFKVVSVTTIYCGRKRYVLALRSRDGDWIWLKLRYKINVGILTRGAIVVLSTAKFVCNISLCENNVEGSSVSRNYPDLLVEALKKSTKIIIIIGISSKIPTGYNENTSWTRHTRDKSAGL